MSWGHRADAKIYTPNSGVLDEAAAAILKTIKVDRTHDVPYVGSCNIKGDTVYIDFELPAHLVYDGKRYDVDRYITMHEVVEMLFEHHLNFSYRDAHQIALHAERALVHSDGLSWSVYSRFCNKWIRKIAARKAYINAPKDIDLQPERDCEDFSTLRRMSISKLKKTQLSLRRQRD